MRRIGRSRLLLGALLADQVAEHGGRVDVAGGGLAELRAASFPAVHPPIGMLLALDLAAHPGGALSLVVGLRSPDGAFRPLLTGEIGEPALTGPITIAWLPVMLPPLPLPAPGEYALEIDTPAERHVATLIAVLDPVTALAGEAPTGPLN